MFRKVNPKENFPELEASVTKFWKDNEVFRKSVEQRDVHDAYVFYDGPPFITGTPHYGSLLASFSKDVVPRYFTMQGRRVERVWGWDCHGLPIETKVEKELGIKNRRDIETFGIQKFIDQCYAYTRNTSAEWQWYIDAIGRWVDLSNSYKTMDQDYMESVMWVFKQIWDKGLVYEGSRTSLYCTRCGTPISNFEIAMDNSYADMEDPAVTIKFPITSEGKFKDVKVLAWTTTPWTLPSNKALVLDPKETYIKVDVKKPTIELERRWVVRDLPKDLSKNKQLQITQAYLEEYKDPAGRKINNARIRKTADKYEFTVKLYAADEKEEGLLIEETKIITKEEYIELIKQTKAKLVKVRYEYPLENGLTAEVDVYQGAQMGHNVVEVEFTNAKQAQDFIGPEWFGKEITDSYEVHPKQLAYLNLDQINAAIDSYNQAPHNYQDSVVREHIIIAKKRLDYVLKGADFEIIEEFPGKELLGLSYQPPFSYYPSGDKDHKIYEFERMVNMEEGTGIVHSAPGFGDIDTDMGDHYQLNRADSVDDEGKFRAEVKDFTGIYIKEADPLIINNLKGKDILFKSERIVHRYPFCYRCTTPLIHKAQPSWFINIQKLKPDLKKYNDKINWIPDHLKHGRFEKGIESAPDWCISRSRYWATPLPVWQKIENGEVKERVVIGSRDELRAVSTTPITKIVFVRHASRDKSIDDGSLNDDGWKQVELLNIKLANEKFDGVFSSPTARAKQTVDELATNKGLKLVEDDLFGSLEDRKLFDKLEADLTAKHGVSLMSELPEDVITSALSELIGRVKQRLEEFLELHKGEYLLVSTHAERIAIIRHIVEGRKLKEALAMDVAYTGTVTFFFNNKELLDLHRPKIDAITIKGETGELTRVKEVLDVWMDSASMPYASRHYPFENKEELESSYPADFVTEYIGQTRAWFYVMHVISTALFDTESFKNVLTTGIIFGTDGRKMSKSYLNYPDPKEVISKYGSEALRLYLMGSRVMSGEDINIDEKGIQEMLKTFIIPLWNCYSFLLTYADMHKWEPENAYAINQKRKDEDEYNWEKVPLQELTNKLDVWIITLLQKVNREVTIYMDNYEIPAAIRIATGFLDDFSRWYIRRSRDRFANGDKDALKTLYYVMLEYIKIIAPITPFLSESIYQNIVKNQLEGQPQSVHLCDYPSADVNYIEANTLLLKQMEAVREISNIGQSIRATKGIKVRQPLQKIGVTLNIQEERERELEQWMKDIIMDELNVKEVVENPVPSDNENVYASQNESGTIKIALYTEITPELKTEGIVRELGRYIQDARKKAGLELGEKIILEIFIHDAELKELIEKNLDKVSAAVSADKINITKDNLSKPNSILIEEKTIEFTFNKI